MVCIALQLINTAVHNSHPLSREKRIFTNPIATRSPCCIFLAQSVSCISPYRARVILCTQSASAQRSIIQGNLSDQPDLYVSHLQFKLAGSLHSGQMNTPTYNRSLLITCPFVIFRHIFANMPIFVTLWVIMASASTILLLLQQLLQAKSV